jgi:hypothetical protein
MGTKPAKHTEATDPFDIEALQLTPEAFAELMAIQKGSGAPTAKPKRAPRQQAERFIQLTETGAKGFGGLGRSMGLVWFEILYRVWKTKNTTIGLPNQTLAEVGVSRWVKARAVARLERAGWIQVKRIPRKSTQVTLLKPECVILQSK